MTGAIAETPSVGKSLEAAVYEIRTTVSALPDQEAQGLCEWLMRKMALVRRAQTYKAEQGPHFNRGQIVSVDFGYNVGAELRDLHHCVVVFSGRSLEDAVVVPLTSQKPGGGTAPFQVNLGNVLQDDVTTLAWVKKMQCVSKLRMKSPPGRFKTTKLPGELMDEIDKAVRCMTRRGDMLNKVHDVVEAAFREEVGSVIQTSNKAGAAFTEPKPSATAHSSSESEPWTIETKAGTIVAKVRPHA